MAGFGAGAGSGPERKRGFDEVTSDDYHQTPVGHAPSWRHRGVRPWMHQYPIEMVAPCTCGQEGLVMTCTTSPNDSDVAQRHVFGPLAQSSTVLNTMYSTQSSSYGLAGYEQPGFAPTMPYNSSSCYAELPTTEYANYEYTNPLYDASVVTNATPDTSYALNGLSYVQPRVLISPQTNSNMTAPAATLPSMQNLQTQARLLPIAPRPSAVPPVAPQDSTPAGAFGCIGTRIRRRYNSEGLSKVNKVREDGACLRCKLYRIGCDRERPCSACQKVSGSAKISRGPCINPRLDTVQAFRAGDGDNGTFSPTLPDLKWVSQTQTARSKLGATFTSVLEHQSESSLMPAGSMTIEITWPFNADIISKCPVTRLDLDRFEPNGQSLAEEWTPVNAGETRMVKLPPLACRDTEAASKAIESFLDECQRPLEQHISGMLHDPILKLTWTEVLRFRDTSRNPALTSAVRMYAAVLMNTRYPKSVRANIFDVAEEPEPPFFFEGNLLPPQLTYQIQMLIAQSQIKMQSDVIRALKHLMFPRNHEKWYTIFLITFVLLSCIELMHHNQTSFLQLKRKNSETNRMNVSKVTIHMLGEWEDSAENLINHFRYVTRGNILFSQQGSSFERSLASSKLDHGAESYIKRMREVISGRIGEMLGMRESRKGSGERQNMWAICELFLPEDTNLP